jgi:hypothetical protein
LKTYYDLVLEGSRDVTRGFVEGFIKGSKFEGEAIIIPHNDIERRGGLKNVLKAVNLKDDETHLIGEQKLLAAISEAVSTDKREIALKIGSYAQIKSAFFEFTMHAFSRKTADEINQVFSDTPNGFKITFSKREEKIWALKKSTGYSPGHEYEFHTSGHVRGNPAHAYKLYNKLKLYELIELGLFRLELGEPILP